MFSSCATFRSMCREYCNVTLSFSNLTISGTGLQCCFLCPLNISMASFSNGLMSGIRHVGVSIKKGPGNEKFDCEIGSFRRIVSLYSNYLYKHHLTTKVRHTGGVEISLTWLTNVRSRLVLYLVGHYCSDGKKPNQRNLLISADINEFCPY